VMWVQNVSLEWCILKEKPCREVYLQQGLSRKKTTRRPCGSPFVVLHFSGFFLYRSIVIFYIQVGFQGLIEASVTVTCGGKKQYVYRKISAH
jgi:hypothetical protein